MGASTAVTPSESGRSREARAACGDECHIRAGASEESGRGAEAAATAVLPPGTDAQELAIQVFFCLFLLFLSVAVVTPIQYVADPNHALTGWPAHKRVRCDPLDATPTSLRSVESKGRGGQGKEQCLARIAELFKRRVDNHSAAIVYALSLSLSLSLTLAPLPTPSHSQLCPTIPRSRRFPRLASSLPCVQVLQHAKKLRICEKEVAVEDWRQRGGRDVPR